MDISKALAHAKDRTGLFETLVYLIYRDWIAKPGSTAIDVGANKGLHTFRMADCVGPKGRVIAFEPLPEMVAKIEASALERYGDNNRIEVRQAALWDSVGSATFYRSEKPSRSSLKPGHASFVGKLEPFEVPLSTLDAALKPDDSKWVSVLKIDAEGAEYNILKGGASFFKDSAPLTVIEFSAPQLAALGVSVDEFFGLLDQIGYSFYNIDGSPFDRAFVESGVHFPCYERIGARRGHWIENFIVNNMRSVVERHLTIRGN